MLDSQIFLQLLHLLHLTLCCLVHSKMLSTGRHCLLRSNKVGFRLGILRYKMAKEQWDLVKFIFRAFCHQRARIERTFRVLKSSYFSSATRRFHSRRWHSSLVCNISASLSNWRCQMFEIMRIQMGLN